MSKTSSILSFILPLLAVLAVVGVSNAQRFFPGYCPTVTAHESFDKTRFFGNWIEVEKTPSIFDLMMRCMVVDYSDDQDNTVNVVVRGVSLAGLPLTVNGDGLLQDVHRAGFYSIRYGFGVPFQGTLTTVIDTDYEDYAVVYSCTNSLLSGVFHSEYIWVLSRSGKISNPTRQNIYEKLDKLQINRSGLTMSDRATCPTNSSVGREGDNNLAQGVTGLSPDSPLGAGPASAGVGAAGSGSVPVESVAGVASMKETVPQPKSSFPVPLLFDTPTSASSSSVGGSIKPSSSSGTSSLSKYPPSPVENKVQLPLQSASSSSQQKQQAAPSSPLVKPAASSPASSSPSVVASSVSSSSSSAASSVMQSPSQPASSQQQQQQQQQQVKPLIQSPPSQSSLLNKLQPKTQ